MLNTRHKLTPLAPAATRRRGGNHYERAIIVAIGFPTSGESSTGDWSRRRRATRRRLTMPLHRHGNFPTAGINFRAPVSRPTSRAPSVYAGVKASLFPSIPLTPFICGCRRREYIAREERVSRDLPVPHARIFGRFHPVTPNVLKIPTEYGEGKIPFIALIHFVGRRRRDFGVTRKFQTVVKSTRFNFVERRNRLKKKLLASKMLASWSYLSFSLEKKGLFEILYICALSSMQAATFQNGIGIRIG